MRKEDLALEAFGHLSYATGSISHAVGLIKDNLDLCCIANPILKRFAG
jgi:hypothetical protein